MKVAIVGGGAAGFFLALNLKELAIVNGQDNKSIQIDILEKSSTVLSKLEISGGGRCNCTNTFEYVKDLSQVYPRGAKFMKKIFNVFSPEDAYKWFEIHGVRLKVEDDGRVFPSTDDSHTIIDMFLNYADKYGIHIKTNSLITSLSQLNGYDYVAITTGGYKLHKDLLQNNSNIFVDISRICSIVTPIPSLFGFTIVDKQLRSLTGTTIPQTTIMIPNTKLKATGSVLITHKGMTGPCVLKLSSFAAKFLNEKNYTTNIVIKWVDCNDNQAIEKLIDSVFLFANRVVSNSNTFALPQRFWEYILRKAIPNRLDIRYKDLTKKEINRIVNILCNDAYAVDGRAKNKEEFITCGGVDLSNIDNNTMQLKTNENLFFAGEVLNIDGITGGYNFQAAWTTSYVASRGIYSKIEYCK
ncbi:MAG: aminoacetone oxidase family FAD-binding enzyme [Bacteroidales bacterium]